MQGTAKMVLNHLKGILAHWKEKITNAFTEGINNVRFRHQNESQTIPIQRALNRCPLPHRGEAPLPIPPKVTRNLFLVVKRPGLLLLNRYSSRRTR
jgi:hypothetical protein